MMEWTQHTFQQKNPNEQKEEAKEDEDHSTITTTKKYGMKEMHAIQINTIIFSFDIIEFFYLELPISISISIQSIHRT